MTYEGPVSRERRLAIKRRARGLADYTVPVSIDHAGRYPSKRPGDSWFEELNGRRFRLELVGKPLAGRAGYDPDWSSTVLCDCRVMEVAQ